MKKCNCNQHVLKSEGEFLNKKGEELKLILYDTRSVSGTTQSFAEKLGRALALPVEHINNIETVDKPYLLCTFTDGVGEVPKNTQRFLKQKQNAKYMQGVVANGSSNFKSTGLFGLAGDRIQAEFGVHLYRKLDMGGTIEDVYIVASRLNYDFNLGRKLNKKEFTPASTFKNGKFNFAPRKITTEPKVKSKSN